MNVSKQIDVLADESRTQCWYPGRWAGVQDAGLVSRTRRLVSRDTANSGQKRHLIQRGGRGYSRHKNAGMISMSVVFGTQKGW